MTKQKKKQDLMAEELITLRRRVAELEAEAANYKRTEEVHRLSHQILGAANRQDELSALLSEFVAIIQGQTCCDAVGIRLLDNNGNIPYQAYIGFTPEFYTMESPLSIKSDKCMCIYVITGETDPSLPFFTPNGSFYMNGTTKFLATVSEEEKRKTRNVCNQMGYESVALIPVKKGETILGLIHLADRRENMVPFDNVRLMEEIAGHIGAATQRTIAEMQVTESLKEKEVLLREVHHRVKNSLAAVIGLLALQGQVINDSTVTAALKDLSGRIKSMALIHERLYRSENLSRIDIQGYLKALISHLRTSFGSRGNIRCTVAAFGIEMDLDTAVPCGMIVNELITNSFKHAFPGNKPHPGASHCDITVSMEWDGTTYALVVADNGVGLPVDLDWVVTKSLGLRLVRMLGQHQLQGHIELDRTNGTRYTLTFGSRHRR